MLEVNIYGYGATLLLNFHILMQLHSLKICPRAFPAQIAIKVLYSVSMASISSLEKSMDLVDSANKFS